MKTVRNIVLGSFAGLILIGFLLTATYVFWVTRDLPSYDALAHYEPPITTRVYAGNGTLIGEYARERRLFVPIQQIPDQVKQAFLSAEDKNSLQPSRGRHFRHRSRRHQRHPQCR